MCYFVFSFSFSFVYLNFLDYLRCSVTFPNAKSLLKRLNEFIDQVESKERESISKIVRIKNGFKNVSKWKSMNDANYLDIKINCIFNNKDNTESQIVEIQFLLEPLLNAKKLGHKYYGIKRKNLFVNSINNIVYNNNNNYTKYQTKILSFISENNWNDLAKEIFLKPNCVLSMIKCRDSAYQHVPILALAGSHDGTLDKMYKIFIHFLFHFGEIILNEKAPNEYNTNCYKGLNDPYDKSHIVNIDEFKNEEKKNREKGIIIPMKKPPIEYKLFLQKYFNFSMGGSPFIVGNAFVKSYCIVDFYFLSFDFFLLCIFDFVIVIVNTVGIIFLSHSTQ